VPGASEDAFAFGLSVPGELQGRPLGGQPFAFDVERGPDGKLHAKDCCWKGGDAETGPEDRGCGGSGGRPASGRHHSQSSRARSRSRGRRQSRSRTGRDGAWPVPAGASGPGSGWGRPQDGQGLQGGDGGSGRPPPALRNSGGPGPSARGGGAGRRAPGGAAEAPGGSSLGGLGASVCAGTGAPTGHAGVRAAGSPGGDGGGHSWGGVGSRMGGSMGSSFGSGKGIGKGRDEGTRFQGDVKFWADDSRGYIECPLVQSDLVFLLEDIPPILQKHDEARCFLLSVGTKVLFTLYGLDEGPPRAREVMPVPAIGDFIIGRVKNYGANSGYGFIKPVEDSPFTHDLYFNHKDFTTRCGDGMRTKLEGIVCKFNVRLTPDGKGQAKNIEVISWPDSQAEEDSARSAGLTLHGIIQTYKINSGYGFINCPKLGRDVWFPRRELPSELMGKDLLGTHVEFDLWVQGDEKPQARSVRALKGNTTDALRLDLMSTRGRASNMSVYDKVAIWQAHTAGQLLASSLAAAEGTGPEAGGAAAEGAGGAGCA